MIPNKFMSCSNREIEEARKQEITFDRAEYMRELREILDSAEKPKTIKVEGREVTVMVNPEVAPKTARDLYAAETNQVFSSKVDTTVNVLQRPEELVDIRDILGDVIDSDDKDQGADSATHRPSPPVSPWIKR